MKSLTQWLQSSSQKWHAWPRGGRKSLCGTLSVEDLRDNPALKIAAAPPADGVLCSVCRRKAGVVLPGSNQEASVASWLGLLRLYLSRLHVRVADATLQVLAARLAEAGTPDSTDGRAVFDQVRTLLLNPMRRREQRGRRTMTIATIPYLKETLALLPPQSGALAQVASTLRLWRNITHRDPTAEHARPDRVVEVILQLPNEPASYIRLLTDRGLPNLNAMFHPNTLRRAKHDTALRGLFAGTNDYWEDTKKQLTVITE